MAGVAHAVYYHSLLPERVASHFNGKGEADGFSSRTTYTWLMASLQVGTLAMFLVINLLVKYLPASLINIPNRKYWLAQERRDETVRSLAGSMYVVCLATQAFMVSLNQLIIWHNIRQGDWARWFWIPSTIYIVYTIAFCVGLFLKYRLPEDAKKKEETAIGSS